MTQAICEKHGMRYEIRIGIVGCLKCAKEKADADVEQALLASAAEAAKPPKQPLTRNTVHMMLDLETLSHHPKAAIAQIGAVIFTLEGIQSPFKVSIDLNDAMKWGEVSSETLKWWMLQSDAARNSLVAGSDHLVDALQKYTQYVAKFGQDVHFWSHASFDFPVLMNAYDALDYPRPIQHRYYRDVRTIEMFYGDAVNWDSRAGVHHDALDDAIFQASTVITMLERHFEMVEAYEIAKINKLAK